MTPGSTLDVAVELIIPDNTAHTVLTALRRLGYAGLKRVQRADQLTLWTAPDAPEPARMLQQLAQAEVLFNPNKHQLSYALQADAAAGAAREQEALVSDRDSNTARLLRLLTGTFGMPYVTRLSRGVLWRLYDEDGPASAERLDWACRTLLSNAVSQTYLVRERPQRTVVREPARAAANGR